MRVVFEKVMPPTTGPAVAVQRDQHLGVTDVEGTQVVHCTPVKIEILE